MCRASMYMYVCYTMYVCNDIHVWYVSGIYISKKRVLMCYVSVIYKSLKRLLMCAGHLCLCMYVLYIQDTFLDMCMVSMYMYLGYAHYLL